jgi:hypothetical protein
MKKEDFQAGLFQYIICIGLGKIAQWHGRVNFKIKTRQETLSLKLFLNNLCGYGTHFLACLGKQ